jgi:hypothetical protein
MKFKFNIQPIYIEADSEQEAWDKFEQYEGMWECNDMESLEDSNCSVLTNLHNMEEIE